MQAVNQKREPFQWRYDVTLNGILRHYKRKISVTWALLISEALVTLLFPLAIGFSVDSLTEDNPVGLIALGVLCVVVLVLSAGRRFYDTRVYAAVYRDLATSLVARKRNAGGTTTALTAQVNLLSEIVEFLENWLPELLAAMIGFVGVILLLGFIDFWLMVCCLVASGFVIVIYRFSEARIFAYNKHQNDEFEKRVAVLKENRKRRIEVHFWRIMKWNIKLSDLETLNYSGVWIILACLLLVSIVLVVGNASISYGQKITSIMYVFQYIEVVMSFPLFYQQIIRLKEITGRLSLSSSGG